MDRCIDDPCKSLGKVGPVVDHRPACRTGRCARAGQESGKARSLRRRLIAVQLRSLRRAGVRARRGILSGYQVKQQNADCIDIAGNRRRGAGKKLRRHVPRSSSHVLLQVRQGAQPEVHQQDSSAFFAHHVFGFNVAVQQTGAVNRT